MNAHELAEQRDNVSGGFRFAAAVVVIGLLFAVGEGSINGTPALIQPEAASTPAQPAATEYFPSGYTLNAAEPTAHVEAF